MAYDIKIKRGPEANLPVLQEGEPALTTDTKKLFIGTDTGNMELATKEQINSFAPHLTSQVAQIINVARDLTLTGVQTITTLPNKEIKSIIVFGVVQGTKKWSQGMWAKGGDAYCNYIANDTGNFYMGGSTILVFSDSAAVNRTLGSLGAVGSIRNGSFDITWKHTGTGATGSAQLRFLVLYHE